MISASSNEPIFIALKNILSSLSENLTICCLWKDNLHNIR